MRREHVEQLTTVFGGKKDAAERVKCYRNYLETKSITAEDNVDSDRESDRDLSVPEEQ